MSSCRFIPMTARIPGAIGVVQLIGDVVPVFTALTDVEQWPIGRLRLCRFADIDEGLAGLIDETHAQIMPHGGPRVMQRLQQWLSEFGVTPCRANDVDPGDLYPEARDRLEACMLHAIARAASPLAIDRLLAQPALWKQRRKRLLTDSEQARSVRLNRLIEPPIVVVAGPANVGKSTLSNALIGRSMSIALDEPGTTRDYTVGRVELAGLVVQWHDTPGLRESGDAIEQRAIDLAQRLMERADLLIAMTDHEHDWPQLPRYADVRVANKSDIAQRDDADVAISATTGTGIAELVSIVRTRLVPQDDLDAAMNEPWLFDEKLAVDS